MKKLIPFLLGSVLERSFAILQRCRQAMTDQGRVLVIDYILPPANEFSGSKFIDVNMLVK
jgi:hypothetical protein